MSTEARGWTWLTLNCYTCDCEWIFVGMFYHVCHLEIFPHSVFFYWGELRTALSPQFPLPKSKRFAFLYIALNSKRNGIKSLNQGKCILNTSTLLLVVVLNSNWQILKKNLCNKIKWNYFCLFTFYWKFLSKIRTQDLPLCKPWRRPLTHTNRNIFVSWKNYIVSIILLF